MRNFKFNKVKKIKLKIKLKIKKKRLNLTKLTFWVKNIRKKPTNQPNVHLKWTNVVKIWQLYTNLVQIKRGECYFTSIIGINK